MAALSALHAACFDRGWSEEEIARLLELPNTIGLVARADEPIGMLLAWVVGEEAEILTMGVAPARRGVGVGAALLDSALEEARLAGAAAVVLEVREDNRAARALYAGAGFAEAGRRRGYYAGADALVLRRNLNGAHA
jgi:ribosomal-protein-alanine N-acetyltransferase